MDFLRHRADVFAAGLFDLEESAGSGITSELRDAHYEFIRAYGGKLPDTERLLWDELCAAAGNPVDKLKTAGLARDLRTWLVNTFALTETPKNVQSSAANAASPPLDRPVGNGGSDELARVRSPQECGDRKAVGPAGGTPGAVPGK